MSDCEINIFPSTRTEALAMLYLQNQDLSGKTPKEIQKMYFEAYSEIKEANTERVRKERLKDK